MYIWHETNIVPRLFYIMSVFLFTLSGLGNQQKLNQADSRPQMDHGGRVWKHMLNVVSWSNKNSIRWLIMETITSTCGDDREHQWKHDTAASMVGVTQDGNRGPRTLDTLSGCFNELPSCVNSCGSLQSVVFLRRKQPTCDKLIAS